jgi:Glycosyl hydrolases family 2, TIM barrel domain
MLPDLLWGRSVRGWHNVSTMAAWQDAVVRDVRDMVIRDRSRPSVIIWGTRLNECKNFPGLWAATRQAARELDSTRPSSGSMAFHGDRTWNEGVFACLLAWAGFDYGSLLGPGPYDIKWAGVADGFRVPKPGAAIYQTQGDPAVRPVIVPVFFWEAAGAVPAPGQTAMIASNCERLEVFIGGTQVASAQPATGSPLYGALAHPPFLVRLPKHLPKPAPDLLIRGFMAGQPGAITLTASHPLLGQAEVQVRSAAVKNTSELG